MIFELIKFTCFGSPLSYPCKEFLNPHLPRTKYNLHQPRHKFNPHPHAKQCGFLYPPRKCRYLQAARVNPPRAGLYYQCGNSSWWLSVRAARLTGRCWDDVCIQISSATGVTFQKENILTWSLMHTNMLLFLAIFKSIIYSYTGSEHVKKTNFCKTKCYRLIIHET